MWRALAPVLVLSCLTACGPATTPDRPEPTAVPTPVPAAIPPPRPTAAPPALSPRSSRGEARRVLLVASPASLPPVRSGRLGRLSDAAVDIALGRGLFEERGLVVRPVTFESPVELLTSLNARQIDVASLPLGPELFNALARGAPLRIVAEAGGAPPGSGAAGLVLRPELVSQVTTPTDLRDFRIAVPGRGDPRAVELAALLRSGFLSRWDVETVALPLPEIGAALDEGAIEAAMIPEPYLSDVQAQRQGALWRRADTILPNHTTDVLVVSTSFATANPDLTRRFVTSYLGAARVYNDAFAPGKGRGRSELARVLSGALAPDEPDLYTRIVMPGINPNGMVNVPTLRFDQQYFLATGQQDHEIDIAAFVDPQYAAHAITQLGEYR